MNPVQPFRTAVPAFLPCIPRLRSGRAVAPSGMGTPGAFLTAARSLAALLTVGAVLGSGLASGLGVGPGGSAQAAGRELVFRVGAVPVCAVQSAPYPLVVLLCTAGELPADPHRVSTVSGELPTGPLELLSSEPTGDGGTLYRYRVTAGPAALPVPSGAAGVVIPDQGSASASSGHLLKVGSGTGDF